MTKINFNEGNDFKIHQIGEESNSSAKVTKIDDKFDVNESEEKDAKEVEEKVRPKFFSASSISIIVITLIVVGIVVFKYYQEYQKVMSAQEDIHNYATNTTTTTEESSSETSITSSMSPEQSAIISKYRERNTDDADRWADEDYNPDEDKTANNDPEEKEDLKDVYFKIVNDKNANNPSIDIDTISIDGHIIDFPASYEYLKGIFGEFTFEDQDEDFNENSTVEDEIYASVEAKTGYGTIIFTFSSEGKPKPLNKCNCIEVQITSINTNPNKQNMTISLPGNVKFGDTYSYIDENFPYRLEVSTYTNHSFMLSGETSTGATVLLTGENDGLVDIIIKFK